MAHAASILGAAPTTVILYPQCGLVPSIRTSKKKRGTCSRNEWNADPTQRAHTWLSEWSV